MGWKKGEQNWRAEAEERRAEEEEPSAAGEVLNSIAVAEHTAARAQCTQPEQVEQCNQPG